MGSGQPVDAHAGIGSRHGDRVQIDQDAARRTPLGGDVVQGNRTGGAGGVEDHRDAFVGRGPRTRRRRTRGDVGQRHVADDRRAAVHRHTASAAAQDRDVPDVDDRRADHVVEDDIQPATRTVADRVVGNRQRRDQAARQIDFDPVAHRAVGDGVVRDRHDIDARAVGVEGDPATGVLIDQQVVDDRQVGTRRRTHDSRQIQEDALATIVVRPCHRHSRSGHATVQRDRRAGGHGNRVEIDVDAIQAAVEGRDIAQIDRADRAVGDQVGIEIHQHAFASRAARGRDVRQIDGAQPQGIERAAAAPMNEHAPARAVCRARVADRDRSRCGRAVEDDFQTVPGPSPAAVADGELIDEQADDRGVRQVDMHAVTLAVRDGARVDDRAQCGSDRREADAVASAVADAVVAFGDIKTARGSIQVQTHAVRAAVVDRAVRDQDRSTTGVHSDGDARGRTVVDDRVVDGHAAKRRATHERAVDAVVEVGDRVVREGDRTRTRDSVAVDVDAVLTGGWYAGLADVESVDQNSGRGRGRKHHDRTKVLAGRLGKASVQRIVDAE